jgi:hypothetical protein
MGKRRFSPGGFPGAASGLQSMVASTIRLPRSPGLIFSASAWRNCQLLAVH